MTTESKFSGLVLVLFSFSSLILHYFLLQHNTKHSQPPLSAEEKLKRHKRSLLSMMGGGANKRGPIDVNLDDPTQFEPLLSASVHLVDIVSDFNRMADVAENTYAGVVAEFCTVSFDIHKKDPSAGTLLLVAMLRAGGVSRCYS
jgi:hypothetical protein